MILGILTDAASATPADGYLGVLLYTFGLLLVLFLLMNLDRRFREYMGRSLVRPFNFFADIRDRRLIPNAQTTLLGFVLSGSFGIAVATLLRGFGRNAGAARYFSAFLPNSIYSPATGLSLNYGELLFWCTVATFIGIELLAILLRFSAMFIRGRYYFADTFNIAVWSLTPLSFLLAYDLILPRMDMSPSTALLSAIILGVILLWSYARFLKGAGVLFDIYPTKIYGYGAILIAILIVIVMIILQN
ncbi:MAG: hypothetical protein ACHQNE_04885 [Candidatus Kapaibacterium sp.]